MLLVALNHKNVVASLLDGHFAAIVLGRVRGIGRYTEPGQVHLLPMVGHGSLFVGISGHGNLVDQALIARHEIDQGERFLRFGLLLIEGNLTLLVRLRLSIPSRRRVSVLDHLAIQMK